VWERWLDPELQDIDELDAMIRVASPGVLRHYPVDRKVGSVKYDDESCIAPIELGAATLF
jgi:putative SOS response-associated peptidase YedK